MNLQTYFLFFIAGLLLIAVLTCIVLILYFRRIVEKSEQKTKTIHFNSKSEQKLIISSYQFRKTHNQAQSPTQINSQKSLFESWQDSEKYAKLEYDILQMLNRDQGAYKRLLHAVQIKYPDKNILWQLEKVKYDLERDRFL